MKTREKFRDEIVRALEDDEVVNGKTCLFMKDNVIPRFVPEENVRQNPCGFLTCETCSKMFAFWLDEEYVEPKKPEVDWSKVPVDTLVRVRDYEYCEWNLRYFKGIDKSNPKEKYEAWSNGATSKTADDSSNHWKYCELVEDADDCNQD